MRQLHLKHRSRPGCSITAVKEERVNTTMATRTVRSRYAATLGGWGSHIAATAGCREAGGLLASATWRVLVAAEEETVQAP